MTFLPPLDLPLAADDWGTRPLGLGPRFFGDLAAIMAEIGASSLFAAASAKAAFSALVLGPRFLPV